MSRYPAVKVRRADGVELELPGKTLAQLEPYVNRSRHLRPLAEIARIWPGRQALVEMPPGDAPGRPGYTLVTLAGWA
jgi:hypothetical protein